MKKLITLVVVALFATATFAQETKTQAAPAKQMANAPTKMKHECYMMKDGALVHCTGDNSTPQKSEVKLRNGSMISPDGMVKTQDGKATKLENGQCVSMTGVVGDCEKMHAVLDNKMNDKMGKKMGDNSAPVKK